MNKIYLNIKDHGRIKNVCSSLELAKNCWTHTYGETNISFVEQVEGAIFVYQINKIVSNQPYQIGAIIEKNVIDDVESLKN